MLQLKTSRYWITCHCAYMKLLMENLETKDIAAHFVTYVCHTFNRFLSLISDLNFYCRELVSYDDNFELRLNKILYCNSQHNQSGRKEVKNKSNISKFLKLNHILCFPDGSRTVTPTSPSFPPGYDFYLFNIIEKSMKILCISPGTCAEMKLLDNSSQQEHAYFSDSHSYWNIF